MRSGTFVRQARRAEHDAAVNRGNTVVETHVKRRVADGETESLLRLVDGKLVRFIAARMPRMRSFEGENGKVAMLAAQQADGAPP